MKHKSVLKDFSALSFEAGQVTNRTVPAIPNSSPRLTPESVCDFNVQHTGSANGDSPEDDSPATTRHWPERAEQQGKVKKTILALAEKGDTWTRLRLTTALTREEFIVRWTTTEAEALSVCAREHVDLLFLDFDRPLRLEWKKLEHFLASNSEVPVVFLTEQKTEFERAVADRTGALLEKPVSIPAVIHIINTLLGRAPREHFRDTDNTKASSPHAA